MPPKFDPTEIKLGKVEKAENFDEKLISPCYHFSVLAMRRR
jgi:hypothetical protein